MYILRKSTEEEIQAFAKDTFAEIYQQSSQCLIKEMLKNGDEFRKPLLEAFHELFQTCAEMQSRDEKKPITYIQICYLKAALMTETYEIMIHLYDKKLYFDKAECYGYWYPAAFRKYFEEDIENFYRRARNHLVQFGYEQLQGIKMRYYDMYLALIQQYLYEEVEHIINLPSFAQIAKEENFGISFGGYREKGLQLYP